MESASVSLFFQRLRTGDRSSATDLWQHFFPRLLGLARRVLLARPLPVLDAEEVAASAFASFWKRADRGDFAEQLDRNELWRIMATITVRKARRKISRELTAKRGGGRIRRSLGETADGDGELCWADLLEATPAADFDLACEELLEQLANDELRSIALFRLIGYRNQEIAKMLDCTERKVERKLQLIRAAWADSLTPD